MLFSVHFALPQSSVPDLDLPVARVAAGRGEAAAVRAEGQAVDDAGVTAQRDRLGRFGGLQVPNLDGRIPAAGGQVAAVRAEDHLPDVARVALQGAGFLVPPGV